MSPARPAAESGSSARAATLLSALLALGFAPAFANQSAPSSPAAGAVPLLAENFDQREPGAAPKGWTVSAPARTSVSVETVADANRALRLTDDDPHGGPDSGYATASARFAPQAERVTLSWRMRQESGSNWNRFFVLGGKVKALELYTTDQPVGEQAAVYGLYHRDASGTDVLVAELPADRWHQIQVTLDLRAATAEIRINGAVPPPGERAGFRANVSRIDRVLFGTGGSSSQTGLWIDDLVVSR